MQKKRALLGVVLVKEGCLLLSLSALGAVGFLIACAPDPPIVSASESYAPYGATFVPNSQDPLAAISGARPVRYAGPETASVHSARALPPLSTPPPEVVSPLQSPSSLYREVKIKKSYLSYRSRGRSRKAMRPRYITIHSTQNWSRGADAYRHSLALKKGALGSLSWHYTVDQNRAIQHLPTNEQGNHADFDGPGNRYSIGIEMCENRGNSRPATVERTAKLAAWLCVKYDLPASRVVPHYHWPRKGKSPQNKNCPHFLLNKGRPGAKWRAFVKKVDSYRSKISSR